MINRLTKIQLIFFAIITLIGGAYVGGKYAQVDRLFIDRTFPVTAQFSDSGGIFAGAQVTYRGIEVGKVGRLTFTDDGVDVRLDIEKDAPRISDDVLAVVANKSAIGEQFVDLQPRSRQAPFLRADSTISQRNTRIPIDTTTLLLNVNGLVQSVDTRSLKTLVDELGAAFEGTGPDLARILDTSSEFIGAAQENLGVTRELIRGSDSVLQTQIDKQGQLSTFSENLAKLSDTLRESDPDLRRLLDEGPSSAKTVNDTVAENSKDLKAIFSDLVTASGPLAENKKSLAVLSILYPYLLEGSYSVVQPSKSDKGEYDATFGLVLTPEPKTCSFTNDGGAGSGYKQRRVPEDLSDTRFDVNATCKVASKVARNPSKTVLDRNRAAVSSSSPGKDTWQWLMVGPAVQ